VAKSNWARDQAFHGRVEDLAIWNTAVNWDETEVDDLTAASETSPEEKLRLLAQQEPMVPAAQRTAFARVQAELSQPSADLGLNVSQNKAVAAALERRLTLIQGPPGTGKTHVAVSLLHLGAPVRKPILATSDSNIAVDNIAEGAHRRGLKVVRVGRPEKITPHLEGIVLEAIFRKQQQESNAAASCQDVTDCGTDQSSAQANHGEYGTENQQASNNASASGDTVQTDRHSTHDEHGAGIWQAGKRRRPWEDLEAKIAILRQADVVCTTTIAAGSDFLTQLRFGAILVDEVAQATELSAIVPLVLRGAEQLVLIGDHCQLPPYVASSEAEQRGLSLSLFSRLAAQGLDPFFLNVQYRMHPMIAAFSSQQFYHGKLQNGVSEHDRLPPKGFAWPSADSGVAFIHVRSEESQEGDSKFNQTEASKVVEVLWNVLDAGELEPAQIGIVSPYMAQVRELRQRIRADLPTSWRSWLSSLEIASVDAFQGREKELIIFSAVRSNRFGRVGFLSDWRRLNVMITRARRGLVIIGDSTTLRKDAHWSKWIDWALRNQLVPRRT